jgi:ketosteroid isomerase-like protein
MKQLVINNRFLIFMLFVIFMLSILSCSNKNNEKKEKITMKNTEVQQTLIDMESAALERWRQGDPDGFMEIIAEDYTYFDPFINERVDGYSNIKKIYDDIRGQVSFDSFELISPNVQVYGDVAVLTFNFKSFGKLSDGTTGERTHWHTTEVFKKYDESWKLISTHWSFTNRQLKKFDKIGAFTSEEDLE